MNRRSLVTALAVFATPAAAVATKVAAVLASEDKLTVKTHSGKNITCTHWTTHDHAGMYTAHASCSNSGKKSGTAYLEFWIFHNNEEVGYCKGNPGTVGKKAKDVLLPTCSITHGGDA